MRKGFTLIELLVVISIIVVLMFMVVPAFGLFARQRSLEGLGRVVKAAVLEARSFSTTRRRIVRVIFGKRRIMLAEHSPAVSRKRGGYTYIARHELPKRVDYLLYFMDIKRGRKPFDDASETTTQPSRVAVDHSIAFRPDGSVDFGRYTDVSHTLFEQNQKGDIVGYLHGRKKVKCLVDIQSTIGSAEWKVVREK